jgi:hypothetical protein
MKPYIQKIGLRYRLFFKDSYGNLFEGVKSFKTWKEALNEGLKVCQDSEGDQ